MRLGCTPTLAKGMTDKKVCQSKTAVAAASASQGAVQPNAADLHNAGEEALTAEQEAADARLTLNPTDPPGHTKASEWGCSPQGPEAASLRLIAPACISLLQHELHLSVYLIMWSLHSHCILFSVVKTRACQFDFASDYPRGCCSSIPYT